MDELPVLRVMSLAQVGERLGIHRSRVMLIERRALAKVRCALALEAAVGSRAQAILANLRGRPVRCYEAALRAAAGARKEERLAITEERLMSQHGWCTKLPSDDGQLTDVWIAWSVPPTEGRLVFTNPRTRRLERQLASSASKWMGPTELPKHCTEAWETD